MAFEAKNTDHVLYIDEKNVEIKVKHDPKAEYKPSPELEGILKEAEEIKKLKRSFLDTIYGPRLTGLLEMVKKYNYNHHSDVRKKMDEEEKNSSKKKKGGKIKEFLKKSFKKNKKNKK